MNRKKYLTLFSLYIAQSIPMSFFSTVLPVILRQQQFSLETIGMLQLVKLPWIFKFLWAPFVDKFSPDNRAYKRWIIYSELFYAAVIVFIAFLDLESSFQLIILLMVIAFTASATQDIASDAFATRILKPRERGMGNGIQASGSFIGTLFGSGVLLAVYAWWGWSMIMYLLAGIVLLALVPLRLFRIPDQRKPKAANALKMKDFLSFFTLKNNQRQIFILVFYYSGLIGVLAMMKPYLVDFGLSTEKIAFIAGIWGTSVAALSALAGGMVIRKTGIRPAMVGFSVLNILAVAAFFALQAYFVYEWVIYLVVALVWMAYAFSSTTVYTMSMERARSGSEGNDFTVQIVLTHLSGLIIAVLSGKIAGGFGYDTLFLGELALGVVALVLTLLLYRPPGGPDLSTNTESDE